MNEYQTKGTTAMGFQRVGRDPPVGVTTWNELAGTAYTKLTLYLA